RPSRWCSSIPAGPRDENSWASEVTMRSIRVGVIGCGYWGPNLVRNFARHPHSEVQAVCDMRYERAMLVGAEYRMPMVTDDPAKPIASPEVHLVMRYSAPTSIARDR